MTRVENPENSPITQMYQFQERLLNRDEVFAQNGGKVWAFETHDLLMTKHPAISSFVLKLTGVLEWPERNRPGFIMFFHDYRADGYGQGMPEDESYHDMQSIQEYMRGVLVHPRNFLGVIDQFGETMQFFVENDQTVLIEFLVKGKNGVFTKHGTVDEFVALITSSGPSLAATNISGAVFEHW